MGFMKLPSEYIAMLNERCAKLEEIENGNRLVKHRVDGRDSGFPPSEVS
jgi:hypothetical protein